MILYSLPDSVAICSTRLLSIFPKYTAVQNAKGATTDGGMTKANSDHHVQLPGVIGMQLEHPHYTRPARFRGLGVPDVLLSGDHAAVARWRRTESLRKTLKNRPDLMDADAYEDKAVLHILLNDDEAAQREAERAVELGFDASLLNTKIEEAKRLR